MMMVVLYYVIVIIVIFSEQIQTRDKVNIDVFTHLHILVSMVISVSFYRKPSQSNLSKKLLITARW